MIQELDSLLASAIDIATGAGDYILGCLAERQPLNIQQKADNTPVTNIDKATGDLILAKLQSLQPDVKVVCEESVNTQPLPNENDECFWLVDPIDGTKGFIQGLDEYTVNIALIQNTYPVLGVIYAPALKQLFYARADAPAYYCLGRSSAQVIQTRAAQLPWDCVIGRYHSSERLQAIMRGHKEQHYRQINSSLKFCLVAQAVVDLYPRLGPTSLWDTAAGQVILEQAGGMLVDFSGQRLHYSAHKSLLNPFFLALGDKRVLPEALALYRNIRRENDKSN